MKGIAICVVLAFVSTVQAQNNKEQDSSAQHHCDVMKRGDQAMGFSHDKTTHHFRLAKDGGAIEVSANDPKDTASRDQIRQHLMHIAKMFSAGDFNTPMFIHGAAPPGIQVMAELRDQIKYQFQETESGGRVQIQTSNAKALDAVQAFLRFQIADHTPKNTLFGSIQ